MAGPVEVSSVTGGVSIAAEAIGAVHFQQVKLIGGQAGSSQAIPGDSALGLGVQVLNVPQVAVSSMPAVSGTVSVSGPVQVSGAVSVSAMPAVSISVSAVLGTVITVLGTQVVTLATGGVVTMVGAVSVTGVSIGAVVSGVVSVSVLPAISISVSAALGTVITILGTQVVTLATAGVVTMVGTVPVNLGTAAFIGSTTAVSGVSGPQIWLGASQTVIVNTLAAGFSVNALVTGVVSVSVLPAVSISVSAALGTVITILGTQVVTLATGGVITMVGAVSVTGVSIGVVVSGVVSVSVLPAVSISVSAVLGTIITVLGTVQMTQAPMLISTSQTIGTIVTLLGTQIVSVVQPVFCMLDVSLTAAASSGSTVLFTVFTGASAIVAGTSAWPVPAGKVFQVVRAEMMAVSSGVGVSPTIYLVGATAAASLTLGGLATLPVFANVNATSAILATSVYTAAPLEAYIPAAVTVGIIYTNAAGTSFTVARVRIYGNLI